MISRGPFQTLPFFDSVNSSVGAEEETTHSFITPLHFVTMCYIANTVFIVIILLANNVFI